MIGIYAAATAQPVRRLVAFGAGGLAGIAPLLLYNQWAFGSAFSLSYTSAVSSENEFGVTTVGNHDEGFYGSSSRASRPPSASSSPTGGCSPSLP